MKKNFLVYVVLILAVVAVEAAVVKSVKSKVLHGGDAPVGSSVQAGVQNQTTQLDFIDSIDSFSRYTSRRAARVDSASCGWR